MHVIESIGPVLGIVAFVGLAILAFLLFQQARDIRRLREWAGRAPERAQEAAEAVQAAADASRGDLEAEAEPAAGAPRLSGLRAAWPRMTERARSRLAEVDRRLPVDGRYLLAVGGIAVIAAGVLTSGFGVLAGDEQGKHHRHAGPKPSVAVLNGTAIPDLAARVNTGVVEPAGYKTGTVANAGSSFTTTVVMFAPGHQAEAKALATAIRPKLGETPTQEMTSDVKSRAGGAPLALNVGLDDSRLGAG